MGEPSPQRQRISEEGDDDRVTMGSLRRVLSEFLLPVNDRLTALEANAKANSAETAAIKQQVCRVEASVSEHGSRISSMEQRISASRASSDSGGNAAWGPGRFSTDVPRASPMHGAEQTKRPQPPPAGSNTGPSEAGSSSQLAFTRIEFLGLHEYERRMEQALDSTQAKKFLRELFDKLSLEERSHFAPWESIEQDPTNNRALVFLPSMQLCSGADVRDKECALSSMRKLLATGAHDVNGRRPRVRGPVPEHLRNTNRTLARCHQCVRFLSERFQLSPSNFKVQAAGARAEVWWTLGRPLRLWVADHDNVLHEMAHVSSLHPECTEVIVRECWSRVLSSAS